MKKKPIERLINVLKSFRFRVFVIVTLSIMIPSFIFGVLFYNISVGEFQSKKIDRLKINNTMLVNSIISEGYLDENTESTTVETQIAHLAGEYNCRVQIINSQYVIVSDTEKSEVGKSSVAENVIKSMSGKDIYINNEDKGYVEFAKPLTVANINQTGKKVNKTVGVLYIRYAMEDVFDYKKNMEEIVIIAEAILTLFALISGWACAMLFNRPIKRIHKTVRDIVSGSYDSHSKNNESGELAQINQDFSHFMDRMRKQEQARQEFVSNVSHELKTPITSMKVLAESLIGNEGMPEELYQEFLRDICKEIDRENDIITDLLDLVKMEKPDSTLNISTVNINEILETVLKRLKPIAEDKNIELVFESFRPVIADVDELKFASVSTNLVENAIKYNNTDGTVTVSLNSDHQYFYLKVIDTGIGISEEDQERVFERFFRVDKARSRETGGTGLGLAIAKDIVKKHHGSIKIHSKEGEGTTFIVRIPLKYIA